VTTGRILVVDDEENVRKSWSRALRLAGYTVRMAGNGDEALRECDEHHFDLVILDFLMPSMTGVELLRRIRKKLPHVRSIIVSGKIDERMSQDEITRTLRETVEADLYLHKPISNQQLRESVKNLLGTNEIPQSWAVIARKAVGAKRATIESARKASKDLKKHVRKKEKQ